ncbi:hypothetical protein AAC387_Pa10g1879 [Persea americana]
MGVTGFSFEFTSPVAPSRMFKASVLDACNLAPKILPEVISSAALVHGDGGVGSVKQYKFTSAVPYGHVNERVDELDEGKMEYKYSVTEGSDIGSKLLSAVYHIKVGPSGDGGCVYKLTAEYQTVPGVNYTDEEVNVGKEGLIGMFKAVEGHLLANPQAYA